MPKQTRICAQVNFTINKNFFCDSIVLFYCGYKRPNKKEEIKGEVSSQIWLQIIEKNKVNDVGSMVSTR